MKQKLPSADILIAFWKCIFIIIPIQSFSSKDNWK